MGSFSIWHWLIVFVVVALLFGGGGKMSRMLGDLGKGLRVFQRNLKGSSEDEDPADDDNVSASDNKETEKIDNKAKGSPPVTGTKSRKSANAKR